MADNRNHQLNTDQIRELLSPYLDGEVTDEERALIEQELAASAQLQGELETLQRTIGLVAAMPPIPAPRPFTLTEADVRTIAPASKNLFGLPSWVKGWAALAATLLCVVVAGGLFWSMQFGGANQQAPAPAAEIASAPQVASTTTTAEVQSAAAPADPAAQKQAEADPTDAENMVTTEPTPREETALEAPAGEENMADAAKEEAVQATLMATASPAAAVGESSDGEEAQEAAPAGEATTTPSQAITATEADQTASSEDASVGAVAPTSPPATSLTFAAPATEAVEEEAASAAEAENEPAAAEGAAPPAPAGPVEPGQQERNVVPKPVEIQNLNLEVAPSLIQLRGTIEATPGSTLSATLQRNGEPFDSWADPATLQAVVQPNGQFSLTIQANTGRLDQDLFAIEPATYQIILTSLDGVEPVVAVVPFDTFPSPAVTPASSASATSLARLTIVPSITPMETATATEASLPEDVSPNATGWFTGTSMAVLGVLAIIIGLVVWLIYKNKN